MPKSKELGTEQDDTWGQYSIYELSSDIIPSHALSPMPFIRIDSCFELSLKQQWKSASDCLHQLPADELIQYQEAILLEPLNLCITK